MDGHTTRPTLFATKFEPCKVSSPQTAKWFQASEIQVLETRVFKWGSWHFAASRQSLVFVLAYFIATWWTIAWLHETNDEIARGQLISIYIYIYVFGQVRFQYVPSCVAMVTWPVLHQGDQYTSHTLLPIFDVHSAGPGFYGPTKSHQPLHLQHWPLGFAVIFADETNPKVFRHGYFVEVFGTEFGDELFTL